MQVMRVYTAVLCPFTPASVMCRTCAVSCMCLDGPLILLTTVQNSTPTCYTLDPLFWEDLGCCYAAVSSIRDCTKHQTCSCVGLP
jgi:hypothetical protein